MTRRENKRYLPINISTEIRDVTSATKEESSGKVGVLSWIYRNQLVITGVHILKDLIKTRKHQIEIEDRALNN